MNDPPAIPGLLPDRGEPATEVGLAAAGQAEFPRQQRVPPPQWRDHQLREGQLLIGFSVGPEASLEDSPDGASPGNRTCGPITAAESG